MISARRIRNTAAALGLLAAVWGVSSCDDGNLSTVIEQETLAEYMEAHPTIRLYLNAVSNYREPMYICMYRDGDTGFERMTPNPLGRYGSADGIPYGEITAVEMPAAFEEVDQGRMVHEVFTTDGLSPCPAEPAFEGLSATSVDTTPQMDDASFIRLVEGVLSSAEGGEEWMVCGETGDGPCAESSQLGSGGTGLLPNSPLDPEKTTVMFWKIGDRTAADDATYTFCWSAADGTLSDVGPYPIPYEPPYRGWFDVDPLVDGTILLFDGSVACADADPTNAITSAPIPADATFGPDGSTVLYEAGSSGTLLVIGQSVPGIPAEAGLKIIPILHWPFE